MFEEIMDENFTAFSTNNKPHSQDTQRTPSKINTTNSNPGIYIRIAKNLRQKRKS